MVPWGYVFPWGSRSHYTKPLFPRFREVLGRITSRVIHLLLDPDPNPMDGANIHSHCGGPQSGINSCLNAVDVVNMHYQMSAILFIDRLVFQSLGTSCE